MSDVSADGGGGAHRRHSFLLKLTDKPGGMELIAATFAHRGISLTAILGNDGTLDPNGHATVLVTFTTTDARKEALQRTLARLARVVSVTEEPDDAPGARVVALVRLAPDAPAPDMLPSGTVERLCGDPVAGETIYTLIGPPDAVDVALRGLRASGSLRAVNYTMLAV